MAFAGRWVVSGQGRKPTRAKRRRLMELIIIFGAPWWKAEGKQNKSKWSEQEQHVEERATKERTARAKAFTQLFEFSALTFILNFTERRAICLCACVCVGV